MEIFLAVFSVFAIVIAAMAVGLARGRPIKGTCGGIANLGLNTECDICGGNTDKCEEESSRRASPASLPPAPYYDAATRAR